MKLAMPAVRTLLVAISKPWVILNFPAGTQPRTIANNAARSPTNNAWAYAFNTISTDTEQWRQEGRAKGSMRPGRYCARGGIWRGKNIVFWNLAASGELAFALQNGFGRNLHYVTTPQLSTLLVTHQSTPMPWCNIIGISIADLIGGGSNTDVCPGRQTPSRRHWHWNLQSTCLWATLMAKRYWPVWKLVVASDTTCCRYWWSEKQWNRFPVFCCIINTDFCKQQLV